LYDGTLTTSEISPTTTYQNTKGVTTFAGSGSELYADELGVAASFCSPSGVALDVNGIVYVADFIDEFLVYGLDPGMNDIITAISRNN
jgi:hypothetical protein